MPSGRAKRPDHPQRHSPSPRRQHWVKSVRYNQCQLSYIARLQYPMRSSGILFPPSLSRGLLHYHTGNTTPSGRLRPLNPILIHQVVSRRAMQLGGRGATGAKGQL